MARSDSGRGDGQTGPLMGPGWPRRALPFIRSSCRGTGHQGEILLRQTRLEPEARGRDGACTNLRTGNVRADCRSVRAAWELRHLARSGP